MLFKVNFLLVLGTAFGKPFFYDTGRALTSFVTSASSASSSFPISSNIADLRNQKLEEIDEKTPEDDIPNFEQDTNEVAPSLLQKKLNKVLGKLRFIYQLSSGTNNPEKPENTNKNDDFDKELDDFDKEFEMHLKNTTTTENVNETLSNSNETEALRGYVYEEPPKAAALQESVQETPPNAPRFGFDPAAIGVYFLELIGSLVGLTYGAAAAQGGPTSTSPSLALK